MAKNEDGFDPSLRLGSGQAVGSGQAKLTNRERWLAKYTALREHVEAHGHLTDRHTQLNHWWKYQKNKRKEGKLTDEQERLLDELFSLRSTEHAGGRKRKTEI